MAEFSRLPERVEAVQWDGTPDGVRSLRLPDVVQVDRLSRSRGLIVWLIADRRWLTVQPGDWIVWQKSGAVWVESSDLFARRYVPAQMESGAGSG